MTEKELNEAIQTCHWRQIFDGIAICRGDCAPCSRLIEQGKCDTLKQIFVKEPFEKEQTMEIVYQE